MILTYRAIILVAVFCLGASKAVLANCYGHDLFPALKSEAPAAYAAIEAAASVMSFRHGKLFRLSHAGTAPSYVFATLHLSDPRITSFSPRLHAAITDSKVAALETVETGAVLRVAIAKDRPAWRGATVAGADQRADRLLNRTDFAQFEAVAAGKGIAKSAVHTFKPSVLALMLDLPSCATGLPGAKTYVDELVANIARENNIPAVGLETLIEQLKVLDGMPRNTAQDLLIAILRQAERGEDVNETMVARYAEGDIGGMLAWLRSAEPIPGVAQAQIPQVFVDRLITQRNYRMRDRALPLLKRGGAFIAVGASHLPGEEGLLSLFERDGFTVETIE
jgi:uncharacterized protein YbaP (TraB family)